MRANTEIRAGTGAHVVQFYDDEHDLVALVSGCLSRALTDGATALVIAGAAHRELFCHALAESGVDIESAQAEARLSLLDAQTTVAAFLVDGLPDRVAFERVIGSLTRAAAASGRPVLAYGEMVAYLWEAGNVVGALQLETLWNELAETVPFSLLCGYPSRLMESPDTADAFMEVCCAHSAVVAGAPVADDAEATRRFPRAAHAPSHARRFVADTLRDWGRPELGEDAALVVTELATNALVHARSGFTVSLSRVEGAVRIAVGDVGSAAPERRVPDMAALGGRGLHLVAALARDWGHTVVPDGKVVWADVATGNGEVS